MAFSSYQIERLIDRVWGWFTASFPPADRAHDPVRLTARGVEQARGMEPTAQSPAPVLRPRDIADERVYAPVVEEERERRAGSFMRPPYPDSPPPRHIPRLRPAQPPESAADARPEARLRDEAD